MSFADKSCKRFGSGLNSTHIYIVLCCTATDDLCNGGGSGDDATEREDKRRLFRIAVTLSLREDGGAGLKLETREQQQGAMCSGTTRTTMPSNQCYTAPFGREESIDDDDESQHNFWHTFSSKYIFALRETRAQSGPLFEWWWCAAGGMISGVEPEIQEHE